MSARSPMAARLTKLARGKGDGTRQAYALGRRLLSPGSFLARRRIARGTRPPNGVAVPEDDGFKVFSPGLFPEADESVR
jgi:hypothetical protein